jgi:hypothetical protein
MRKLVLMTKVGLVLLAVIGSGLLVGMTAARTDVTFTDLFNPLGVPNPLNVPMIGRFLDPGKVMCPGHTLTTDPMQPCPKGSRILIRGFEGLTRIDSESPSLTGWMTLEINANLTPNYTGPVWGKFSDQLDAGGKLEGTWHGTRRKAGESVWIAELHVVGHGAGEEMEGIEARCVEVVTEITPAPILFKGVGTCRFLDHEDE